MTFDLTTNAGALQGFDHRLLVAHGCGQERGNADNVGAEFLRFGGEFLARDVDSEIMDLKSMSRQERADENLADLVDVPLRGSQHDDSGPGTVAAELLEFRIEHGHGGAHGFSGGHHVGEEHLSASELLADIVHAGDVSVVNGVEGAVPAAIACWASSRAVSGAPAIMLCAHERESVVVPWKYLRPC